MSFTIGTTSTGFWVLRLLVSLSRILLVGALGTWFPRRNTSIYTTDDDCFRMPLDFLQGDKFCEAAVSYIQPLLTKGVPSLFSDLSPLYNHYGKGTAGVALAGLLGTVRAQGRSLDDFPNHKIVVVGAGSAGLGVLSMAVQAVVRMTGNAETAAQNFFLLDKDVQFCTSFLAFFILFVQSLLCSFRYVMSFLLCNEDVDFMN
ncbi:hypothetical protein ERO13_D04G107200v2 [Gossypium hirsutum]|uniref:NAD-dependent malic enzyme isoform X1 n=3 Tax=Gossypium TaxID=3633 RepID=A0A1U8IXR8_GOSHI|nr:NAD-dependent malic enzyme isoform X1 [Gossypium hirsutum]KAB2035027.1 hypothetical protein ES319_D04G123800v1 [Gossypium barbadense]KAG4152195.1 hypothetical protein ERO13_D04G107200v2 [Gossypium hirsutum]TYG73813.1 hypothetical protein ES288_D04G132000v1 [Gossypium darwinii]